MTANQTHAAAIRLGRYVDKAGREWWRGADGWYFDDGDETSAMRHTEMLKKMREEGR